LIKYVLKSYKSGLMLALEFQNIHIFHKQAKLNAVSSSFFQ
jgi:hypothetical protein